MTQDIRKLAEELIASTSVPSTEKTAAVSDTEESSKSEIYRELTAVSARLKTANLNTVTNKDLEDLATLAETGKLPTTKVASASPARGKSEIADGLRLCAQGLREKVASGRDARLTKAARYLDQAIAIQHLMGDLK